MIYCKEYDISSIFVNAEILKRKKGNRAPQKKRRDYISILSCFDIETTRIPETDNSVMYIWQWGFYDLKTNKHICCLYGRTWEEYKDVCDEIKSCIEELKTYNTSLYMVRLVHNLAYEFQFLSGIIEYKPDDVFAIKKRRPVRADSYGCIEDRCTFVHSNLSLDKYAKQWGAEHKKLSGQTFDYQKERYYFTELTDYELSYCENDILSCIDAYTNEMKYYDDNLYSVPLTSTGYVRRDAKRAWSMIPFNTRKKWVISDLELYTLLNESFRGGNTHANRFFVAPDGHEPYVLYNVKSFDRSSSYPDVMCNMKFPLGTWHNLSGKHSSKILDEMKSKKFACVFRAKFTKLRLKDFYWGCPYISKDKCYNLRTSYDTLTRNAPDKSNSFKSKHANETDYIVDNGRILEADEVIISITDVDFMIIEEEYEWDELVITDFYYCRYTFLPDEFRDLIRHYYKKKTELKNVSGREWEYAESKSKINSLYGMAAQKSIKDSIVFNNEVDGLYEILETNKESQLQSVERKGFLPFSIGVWVTAWARYWLERAIRLIHDTKGAEFIYTDTDSVKFTGEVDFSQLNDELKNNSIQTGSFAVDSKGKTHYMGVYEYEGSYEKFATMGAKKYIYGNDDDLHVTIAGVVKYVEGKEISAEELKELGGFKAFKSGTTFVKAGGLEAVYNDNVDAFITKDGHKIHVTRNVCLKPSTYTLGLAAEYDRTLQFILSGLDNLDIL